MLPAMLFALFFFLSSMPFILINAIPIPNGQIGKAEVECGEESIDVIFLTENVFEGRIYVVGHSDDEHCVSRNTGRKTTSISIRKDQCSVTVTRTTNPTGMFVSVKVMISFHKSFVTKVDRGYEISCFFMEADKIVTYPLTVSMKGLEPLAEQAEMPRCHYEVVDPITMEALSVVAVGSKLLHKWACESSSPELWCMTVHSCFVEDGSGTQVVILNDQGCAIDRYLLDNLEYGPGPLQAQKEAHAFKFADRVVVNFQCSVRLDIRPGGECPRPNCPDLSNQRRLLSKRSALVPIEETVPLADVDVRAQSLDVLDPQIGMAIDSPRHLPSTSTSSICVPVQMLIIPSTFCLTLLIALFSAVMVQWRRRSKTPLF